LNRGEITDIAELRESSPINAEDEDKSDRWIELLEEYGKDDFSMISAYFKTQRLVQVAHDVGKKNRHC
jgi:hypothetical protein